MRDGLEGENGPSLNTRSSWEIYRHGKPLSDEQPVVDPQTIHTRSVICLIHLPNQPVINKFYDTVVKNDHPSILDFEHAVGDDGRW
jgi:hypothetical protein